MKATMRITIDLEIDGPRPFGCGDATHEAAQYAEAVEAVRLATEAFWQTAAPSAKLTGCTMGGRALENIGGA